MSSIWLVGSWESRSPFLKEVSGYRLKLRGGRLGLPKYATEFDLVNDFGKADVHRLFEL